MASIIKIKRSSNPGSPSTLGQGELAYSYASGNYSTLGDRLFIGTGAESGGDAALHSAIGGLYYTRLIDASVPGTLTTNANSIPVLNSLGKIDKWYAGNTYINGNTITTTGTNENLVLDPNGSGMVQIAGTWTLPRSAGTNNYILKTNGSDTATWSAPTTYIGTTAVNLFNSSGDVSALNSVNLNGGNYNGNYVKVSDVGFGPALGTTNSDSAVRIETGASGTVNHLWTFNANGTTSFNNASYTFPAADGSVNYYLKTDGAGGLSWASAATNLDSVLTAGNSSTQSMTVGNVTVSSLNTNESVVFTNSDGKLINSSNFTYDTDATILHVGEGMFNGQTGNSSVKVKTLYSTSLTSTRVPYAGTDSGGTKLQDSGNFTWDNGNQVLKVGSGGTEIGGDSGYGYVKAADVQTGKITNNGHTWLFNANGSTTFNSAYTFPAADSTTNGYVLKSNGAGVLSWVAPNASQIQSDWNQSDSGEVDYIKNKPSLATVATSGLYSDLSGTPTLATVATSGLYSDLSGTPTLATVATSGLYSDLSGTPMLATVATSGLYSDLSGTPTLATVATSGDYNDLINTPDTAAYLNINSDSNDANVSLINDTLDFVGSGAISTAISRVGSTVAVTTSVANASTSGTIGVATFDSNNFDITNAKVSIKSGGITNSMLANSNVTIGNTTVNLGSTVTAFAGITSFQVGNIKIYSDNQIINTQTDGNINLITSGVGVIDVHNTRITSLAGPEGPYDAVNRSYVDAVANGFHVHTPAIVATTANLATITGGTVTYDNGTGGVGATLTLQNAITAIDGQTFGVDFVSGDRILVKNEYSAIDNGIYTINADGDILTRATDFNSTVLVNGGDFIFVQKGTEYGSTGWVQTTDAVDIGTDPVVFSQFAGVGTYKAGIGLYLDGTTFNANVNSSTGGIEIVSNQFQLKSTLAGNGLTYTTGVLNIGGTADRISISSDAIDIASTYVGQTSITTLGTITTGTWYGNTVGSGYGGTGITSYSAYDLLVGKSDGTLQILSKGTGGQILQMNSAGTALTYADLDGGTY